MVRVAPIRLLGFLSRIYSGFLLAQFNEKKKTKETVFFFSDGGLHDDLPGSAAAGGEAGDPPRSLDEVTDAPQ